MFSSWFCEYEFGCFRVFPAGRKGGELASAVHAYTKTGDPYVRSLVKHILSLVSHPVLSFLYRWIYDGELEDAHHEVGKAAQPSGSALGGRGPPLLLCLPGQLPSPHSQAPVFHLNVVPRLCSFEQVSCRAAGGMVSWESLGQFLWRTAQQSQVQVPWQADGKTRTRSLFCVVFLSTVQRVVLL